MNRREWLKTSTIATTGLLVSSSFPSCGKRGDVLEKPSPPTGQVKLNSNESPYGISDKARRAIIEAIDASHLYPHRKYSELVELIAARERLTPEHIILGGGSTEVMNMVIRAFGTAGPIVVSDPTYFDFIYYAQQADCALEHVPLTQTFEHDLERTKKLITPKTGLVYICNPNNPTASITNKGVLYDFCRRFSENVLILVDEAYFEYVEDLSYASAVDLIREDKNIVVTRTFSKIFGMAGLRVGYGMAKPDIIKRMKRLQMNFASIAYTSLKAAAAMYDDLPFVQSIREKNRSARAYLCTQLENRGYTYIPSHTNFVLFEVKRTAQTVAEEFLDKDILVRPFQFRDRQWIRVSLGTLEEMQAFVSALSDITTAPQI